MRTDEFEISHFRSFRTSAILNLDWVTWHIIVYQASTSSYISNLIQNRKIVRGWTNIQIGFIRYNVSLSNFK